jgi:hypothetical protein
MSNVNVRMRDGEVISLGTTAEICETIYDFMYTKWKIYQENNHNSELTQTVVQEKPDSNADELLKYAELYEKGLLTKEEFEAKKKELL